MYAYNKQFLIVEPVTLSQTLIRMERRLYRRSPPLLLTIP